MKRQSIDVAQGVGDIEDILGLDLECLLYKKKI
jgi:hypothetical protein